MNQSSKYCLSVILTLLVLFYSAPIKSLHDCNNLNHNHSETTLETSHDDCLICDLQFHPFENIAESPLLINKLECPELSVSPCCGLPKGIPGIHFNKGPPTFLS